MRVKSLLGLLLALVAGGAWAQLASDDPDWKEGTVPPPPRYSQDKLIPVDMPSYTSLKFGVDPASLALSSDGIVRYVMVASSASGSVNALYEGLRCATGEVKTYARSSAPGQWTVVQDPPWRELSINHAASRHALALARQGACDGRTVGARTAGELIRRLSSPRPY